MTAHDPTLLAWFITVVYLVAAAATSIAARGAAVDRERIFWAGCTALLLLLGFNKQLDLQGYITTGGRSLAKQSGWYEQRRLVQAVFVVTLCAAAAAVSAMLAVWLRRSAAELKVAAAGIVLLFTFVVWRASSFHHMDVWVTRNVAGMRIGWWLELAGTVVIGSAAVFGCRRSPSRTRSIVEGETRHGAQG